MQQQLLDSAIPSDVWAETVLQMLDARDLMVIADVCGPLLLALPSSGTHRHQFTATRALSRAELEWFAARGIVVRLSSVERIFADYEDTHGSQLLPTYKELYPIRVWTCRAVPSPSPGKEQQHPQQWWWWAHHCLHRDDDLPAVEYVDGICRIWCHHGKLHRDGDLPALEYGDHREWWVHGKRHRDNGLPAIEPATGGAHEWWVHGERHRDDDLPAVKYVRCSHCEWYVHGKRHRGGDLPAVVYGDFQAWFVDGLLHREGDRPAKVNGSILGGRTWYIRGVQRRSGLLAMLFLPTHIMSDGSFVVWGTRWRSWRYWATFLGCALVACIGFIGMAATAVVYATTAI